MAPHRVYFAPAAGPLSGEVLLDDAESHHLLRVRRAREGDPVDLYDGHGRRARGRIHGAAGRAARIRLETVETAPPRPLRVRLLLALAKGRAFETAVQKATELGAAEITPLRTAHCEVDFDDRRAGAKLEKWRAIAIESLKQCGNPWLPRINAPVDFAAALKDRPAAETGLVAALHPEARPLGQILATPLPPALALLVGPEGDLSPAEYEQAFAAGFRPFTLGPYVLRVETAVTAALALLLDRALAPTTSGPVA